MVFGKTTPAKLREVTGQSKATMFRNLARLYDAGILKKEEVKDVDDQRYNLHYYISKNLMDYTKGLYSKKLAGYAESIGKEKLIQEWMNAVEALPYLLHQQASQLILLKAQRSSSNKSVRCDVVSKLLIFRLGDISQVGDLQKGLESIAKSIDSEQEGLKRDWKEPLANPVAVSISVVALNPKGLPSESGTIIEIKKC